ncbi:isoprenylcysteine carboxylmethyltransferase family protein [Defluviimonas sp. WL0002]|uniref:Isoprenylcysteine carboxylmethyltransferase family protein n=1 Tax=Albidovulum marisflavi TaxID=2984159 RepID=A0ABT2ZF27_9RHOB|nr:isoprenylcysteine carboxylmethyltransferase family protein [Defluviimonas sp. WL0002]MCV2869750.1 isoprenylcysteine carboxylmethyltransferase family protein [Defluviimonas sp. WL0002]
MRALKSIDYPPVWLVGFLALSWAVGRIAPMPALPATGLVLAGFGVVLMLIAVGQMIWSRTTFVPRKTPDALVSGGVFSLTRNPIYLGDAMILAGLSLYWNALLALPLVAVFVWIIGRRFIESEESVLKQTFGQDFEAYRTRTRRWL